MRRRILAGPGSAGDGPRWLWVVPVAVLATLLGLAPHGRAEPPGPARATAAAPAAKPSFGVSSESAEAARAALATLRGGGSAADAAVVAALVAGVTNGVSSGIGGGGFAMVWDAHVARATVIDFRETAPQSLDLQAFEQRPLPPEQRGKLVGTPGELAGLSELHRRWGKLPWEQVVAPAVRVARRGFPAGPHLARMARAMASRLRIDPALGALYAPRGKPIAAGGWLRNPALAATLERVAAEGPSAFYTGEIARELTRVVQAAGGALSLGDLSSYRPRERRPLHVTWDGADVFTMPPPSAGGAMLAQVLRLYSPAELRGLGDRSGAYVHMVAEAQRAAVADRMRYLGDPDHQPLDLAWLLSPARMAARRASIALDRTHGIPRFGLEEHGTHHLVTADAQGNVVSLTTTVNSAFGAKLMAPMAGVVLNDELDDFAARSWVEPFGMTESPNRPRPGARPLSSMTPTIVVRKGQAVAALGGSGGMKIATNVTQVLLRHLTFGTSVADAVGGWRFAIPTRGAYLELDPGAPIGFESELEWRGEITTRARFDASAVQMLARGAGGWQGAADPRKHGTALTVP